MSGKRRKTNKKKFLSSSPHHHHRHHYDFALVNLQTIFTTKAIRTKAILTRRVMAKVTVWSWMATTVRDFANCAIKSTEKLLKDKVETTKIFSHFPRKPKKFFTVLKCLHPPLMPLHFAHSHTFQLKPRHKDEIYSLFYFQHPPIFHHIFSKCFFPSHFAMWRKENFDFVFRLWYHNSQGFLKAVREIHFLGIEFQCN